MHCFDKAIFQFVMRGLREWLIDADLSTTTQSAMASRLFDWWVHEFRFPCHSASSLLNGRMIQLRKFVAGWYTAMFQDDLS